MARKMNPWMRARRRPARPAASGFTLIELIVVLAIIALLASIVAPRYMRSVDNAREASLRTSLATMRDAIDKYAADKASYPDSLADLAAQGYLRHVPEDPMTGSRDTWHAIPPPADSALQGGMADVRSGADGLGQGGEPYASW